MTRALLLLLALAACSRIPSPPARADAAQQLTLAAGWTGEIIDAAPFSLQVFYPASLQKAATLTVYIEGDGLAWVGSSTISADPTPVNPLALKLALKDPGPAAYLARPCQFVTGVRAAACASKYWTSHRFASDVIASSNAAIEVLKAKFGAVSLRLVGYSGGGAVAALVAAGRHDVVGLITVAGNLDHRAWTTAHHLNPLTGSLNPPDFAASLASIPQTHFIGGKDKVVGEFVARSYANSLPREARPRLVVIPDFDHHCCWAAQWPLDAR